MIPEVAEHLVRPARDLMAADAAGVAEEEQRALLLPVVERVLLTTRVAVDGRVRDGQGELELGDRSRHHLVGDGRSASHLREVPREELAIGGCVVQPAHDLGADRVVVPDEGEPGRLGPLRGRDERLRVEQVGEVGEGRTLGVGEQEAATRVERVPGEGREPVVQHQAGEERRVEDHRRPALVPGSGAVGPDDAVRVDADRDRLRVTEAGRRRMAARACVVVVQPQDRVEPEHPARVGQVGIQGPAEPRRERRLDPAREAFLPESLAQRRVERASRRVAREPG